MFSKSLNTSKELYKVVCNQLKDVAVELKLLALFFFALKNTKFSNQKKEADIIKESSFLIEQV